MYTTYFGFRRSPFSLTPDPRFLYLSAHHREALAHLLYGVGEGGGFVQLTGEVGTGKTTLCRSVLEQAPEQVDLALVLNPRLTPLELVATVCDELGATYPADTASNKVLVDALTRRLREGHVAGRRAVVVIDEAQNLGADALEQIRLLTNLETPSHKLLQIVLIGQPELQQLMARNDLRQIAQRITARYHLPPLSKEETRAYVRHRLRVAGGDPDLFTPAALRLLHRESGGVPRLINILCDRALLGAYAREAKAVGPALVRAAAREVAGGAPSRRPSRGPLWAAAAVAAALVAGAVLVRDRVQAPRPAPAPGETAAAQVPRAEPPSPAAPPEAAPAPPPSPAAPPAVSTSELRDALLAEPPADSPDDPGLAGLLHRWGIAHEPGAGDVCAAAAEAGLRCFRARGSWAEVRRLDRPAALVLQPAPGERRTLLVVGTDGEQVTWDRNGTLVPLPWAAVAPLWYGEFTLLWRPPPGGAPVLGPGSRGPDVAWLAERLRMAAPGEGPLPPARRFDPALRERVRRFQARAGLQPDGIAGRETIMHLNAAVDPTVPRLTAQPG